MVEEKASIDVMKHKLVPTHTIINDEEVRTLLASFNITKRQLPQISHKDPALEGMECNPGNVIRIKRSSVTADSALFYRVVV